MNKKIEPKDDVKILLLRKALQSIFGINSKINFSKWDFEVNKIVIEDIDFNEDLLTVLQSLREYFWVDIDVVITEEEIDFGKGKKKVPCARMDLELIVKD